MSFSFLMDDCHSDLQLASIELQNLPQFPFLQTLYDLSLTQTMQSSYKIVTVLHKQYYVIDVPFVSEKLHLLRDVSVLKIEKSFKLIHLETKRAIEKPLKPCCIDGFSIVEWLRLYNYMNCDIDTKKVFLQSVFAKLLQLPKESILQTVVQQLLVTNSFAFIIDSGLCETLDVFIGQCIDTLMTKKQRMQTDLMPKFEKRVIAPLFALLQDWQNAAQSLSLASISSILFFFSRRFWMLNQTLIEAPNIQLKATHNLATNCLDIAWKNNHIVVKNVTTVDEEYCKWHQWIATTDRLKIYDKLDDKQYTHNLELEKNWIYPQSTEIVNKFSLLPQTFASSDPIGKDLWDFIDENEISMWCCGGAAAKMVQNRRNLDDQMSDVDLYVLKNDSVTVEALLSRIVSYLKKKHKTDSIYAFARGKMFTFIVEGIQLPLQVSFYNQIADIASVYSRFDLSHVHVAHSFQQQSPTWVANVYAWATNIFQQSTFIMHSRNTYCMSLARAAKCWNLQLPLANHAVQYGQDLAQTCILVFEKNVAQIKISDSTQIRYESANSFLSVWRHQLTSVQLPNDLEHATKKRRITTREQEKKNFKQYVQNRFDVDSVADLALEQKANWVPPNIVTEQSVACLTTNYDKDYKYHIDEEDDNETAVEPLAVRIVMNSTLYDKQWGVVNVVFLPIVDMFRRPAGYFFGDLITSILTKTSSRIRKTEPQKNGQYVNCIFARIECAPVDKNQLLACSETEQNAFLVDLCWHVRMQTNNTYQMIVDRLVVKEKIAIN